jgi:predicted DNA-binding transcriptional regulator YafY
MTGGGKDTITRQWTLLKKIPAYPNWISTADVHEYLRAEGFEIDKRTTQRDLDQLSVLFALVSKQDGRANLWQWMRDAPQMNLPAMPPATALAMSLVDQYLQPLLPRSSLNLLKPYFDTAGEVMAATNLSGWRQRVRMLHRGPQLKAPTIRSDVLDVVYQALLEQVQFRGRYKPRGKDRQEYLVNPLGLVVKEGISYLVCTFWHYSDLKQCALHRFTSAQLTDDPVQPLKGFSLKRYIEEEGAFGYPVSNRSIALKARFESKAAHHLNEASLADDQQLQADGDCHTILTATVPDSQEIRWWLLGFGDQVEVLAPKSLREEFAETTRKLAAYYR